METIDFTKMNDEELLKYIKKEATEYWDNWARVNLGKE